MALDNIGACYDRGPGVPVDSVESAKWYRKAAPQGEPLAECNLGVLYADGAGVPPVRHASRLWGRDRCCEGTGTSGRNSVAPSSGEGSSGWAFARRPTRDAMSMRYGGPGRAMKHRSAFFMTAIHGVRPSRAGSVEFERDPQQGSL